VIVIVTIAENNRIRIIDLLLMTNFIAANIFLFRPNLNKNKKKIAKQRILQKNRGLITP